MVFKDRIEAGKIISDQLKNLRLEKPFVLGIARGGLICAAEVARILSAPFDVLVCRKLGLPSHQELGFGAIAPGGVIVLNKGIVERADIKEDTIDAVRRAEETELARRLTLYRGTNKAPDISGKDVIIVDDGIATGVTARAAAKYVLSLGPKTITLAAPVCSEEAYNEIVPEVQGIICPYVTKNFYAVGQFYQDFPQVTDQEVINTLNPNERRLDEENNN